MAFSSVHWHPNAIRQNLWLPALILVSLLVVFRHHISAPEVGDPYHCEAITHTGKWLNKEPALSNWQAPECMLHHYQSKDVSKCLNEKRVLYMGDSSARQAYYGAIRAVNSSWEDSGISQDNHVNIVKEVNGVSFEFYWDPYMNKEALTELKGISTENSKVAMVFISYGMWYAQEMPGNKGPQKYKENLAQLHQVLNQHTSKRFGVAMVSPTIQPYQGKLDDSHKKGLTPARVDILNEALLKQFADSPVYIPTVFLDLTENRKEYYESSGIFVTKPIANLQADILYNLRCNNDISDHFPYSNTCCLTYPNPSGLYLIVVSLAVFLVPCGIISYYFINMKTATDPNSPVSASRGQLHMAIFAMSLALGYCFMTDRTQFLAKGNKNFITQEFAFLSVISLIAGAVTITKSEDAKSTGFLNRHMTDEWKGWMQVGILIYHITGGSKILSIYKPVRVLVASYLFMTGYGHTAFFLSKADFGLKRVLSVLCRLNLLTIFLAYVMNTNYIFYYFSPLVTFWFGVIWITFRVFPQFNSGLKVTLIKVAVSGIVVYFFVVMPGPLEAIFWALKTFARIEWDLKEWRFRLLLDIWAVHFGMIFSIVSNNPDLEDVRAALRKYKFLGVTVGLALISLYWHLASKYDVKTEYNAHNNYLSLLPIMGYVLVRNGASFLCNRHSRFFGWFGKISLETFILQFHIWMAADTKGVMYI